MVEKIVLIADSGATKTDWVIIDFENEIQIVQTMGFNPYFVSTKDIYEELTKNLYPYFNNELVQEVYFYGAGCSNPSNCDIVNNALEDFLRNARKINVEHDLLGTARSLLGKSDGIACILGTGSNSCLYDGDEIVENVPSLGFILGDEGSGSYMGRLLLRDYFFGKLPEKIAREFEKKYFPSLEKVLDAIYNQSKPNKYLASFAYFLKEHIDDPHIYGIVKRSFTDYFKVQISQYTGYKNVPVNAVGSIAFHFKDTFLEVASEYSVNIQNIIQSPLEGLINFHIQNSP